MNKRVLAIAIFLIAAGLSFWAFGSGGAIHRSLRDGNPRHLRLVWTEDPQHRAMLFWSGPSAEAEYSVVLAEAPPSIAGGTQRDRRERRIGVLALDAFPDPTDSGAIAFRGSAQLDTLEPATEYWLRVEGRVDGHNVSSAEHWFRTAPADQRPVTFLSGGDCLDEIEPRRRMNDRMRQIAEDDAAVLALAHAGDFVRDGRELEQWLDWLDDHERVATRDGRLLPLLVARGNHEADGPLFDFVFGAPGGERRNWYRTELAPGVILLTLNTEAPGGGDQARFLEDALRDANDARVRMAQYHRGLYPAVRRPAAMRAEWLPLFDAHRLDLAMESNGHTLKRTPPMRGGEVAEDGRGTIYIGEGGLGARQRSPDSEERERRWTRPPGGFTMRADHVWKVRVDEREVSVEAILADGQTVDRHRFGAH